MSETQTLTADHPIAYTPGAFVWHEMATRDAARVVPFYSALLGWDVQVIPMGDGPAYHRINVGGKGIGGFYEMALPEGVPAHWYGYVSVDDVDATAARVPAAGGRVVSEPKDIPGVGRFAVALDAQGGVFALIRSVYGDPDPEAMPTVGEFCWDSLSATDLAGAKAFYTATIGWEAAEGDVFKMGDKMEASIDQAQPGMPTAWVGHIYVESLETSRAKATELGGRVLAPEISVGEWGSIAIMQDPEGAVFSLFQPNQSQG